MMSQSLNFFFSIYEPLDILIDCLLRFTNPPFSRLLICSVDSETRLVFYDWYIISFFPYLSCLFLCPLSGSRVLSKYRWLYNQPLWIARLAHTSHILPISGLSDGCRHSSHSGIRRSGNVLVNKVGLLWETRLTPVGY